MMYVCIWICFLGQMAWQVYARDSRECFAKVRHQYILSAASAFTFWNNWAFRMQSGAWQAWRWAPEKAIAKKMHLNTTPFMKVSHLLPWKGMCSNTSSLKVHNPPSASSTSLQWPRSFDLFALQVLQGSVCAHFPPVTAYIWRLTPSCELQYFPHTSADTEGL